MENTTKISDLPQDNIQYQLPNVQQGGGVSALGGNNYYPINLHPNPYGNNLPDLDKIQNQIQHSQNQIQKLPSRDININPTDYSQDIETTANYVPKAPNIKDYINEYENDFAKKKTKKKVKFNDTPETDIFVKLQTPLLVAFFYFLFQMTIFNKLLQKYITFLTLFKDDGNISFNGILFKSILFGGIVFCIREISI
jgi:hypothetical protein